MRNVHVVIMAGGKGSRLWPLSTSGYPKQFIDILGCGRSLIQLTVDRFRMICSIPNFWVVTNEYYVDVVKQQLPEISQDHILAEPASRNTAPCIAWACWAIKKVDPNANVVVTPSDAIVMNSNEFTRVINNALHFTDKNRAIVTIGIKPSRPETGYGYLECGESINKNINKVSAFKEKPTIDVAQGYLTAGNYLWNAGIFIWNVDTIVYCLFKYKRHIAEDMEKIISTSDVRQIYPNCEKISIDFAVMEPAASEGMVYTHPAEFGWSDLGNWASLYDKLIKDENGNSIVGNVKMYDCKDCIVHAEDANMVVLQGLEEFIFSVKEGNILVCKRIEEQRIKEFIVN